MTTNAHAMGYSRRDNEQDQADVIEHGAELRYLHLPLELKFGTSSWVSSRDRINDRDVRLAIVYIWLLRRQLYERKGCIILL